ncbi:MAG TPA: DUF3883 domain-containing protein [Blastocatellia bacterium]|nr:DUF3883 domain-containing protein [Blastocatellia bacterium]
MRDEFGPFHGNPRLGWHKRPPHPSRVKVIEAFQYLSEEELRDVVLEILTSPDPQTSGGLTEIIEPISKLQDSAKSKSVFIVRGPTGRKAEEFFISQFAGTARPVPRELIDTRDRGCGYDFEIKDGPVTYFIEVKGLDGDSGGVLFTSKEWDVAKKNGDRYFLAVVRNVSGHPSVQFIRNPAQGLNAKKNIYITVQVSWSVTDAELAMFPSSQ